MEFLTNYIKQLHEYVQAMWRVMMAVHHSFPPEIQCTFVLLVLALVFRNLFDAFVDFKQYKRRMVLLQERKLLMKNILRLRPML